jgi:hypothetical protein
VSVQVRYLGSIEPAAHPHVQDIPAAGNANAV